MKRGRWIRIFGGFCVMLLLAGCAGMSGGSGTADVPAETAIPAGEAAKPAIDRSTCDWRTTQWVGPEKSSGTLPLYVQKYYPGETIYDFGSGVNQFVNVEKSGTAILQLYRRDAGEGEYSYYLDRYQGGDGSCESLTFDLPALWEQAAGEDGTVQAKRLSMRGIDLMGQDEYVFLLEAYGEESLQGLYAVHTDRNGGFRKAVDLYPAFAASGLHPVTELEDDGTICLVFRVDAEGYYYVNDWRLGILMVLDGEGSLQCVMGPSAQEERVAFFRFLRDPDGGLVVFAGQLEEKDSAWRFDHGSGRMERLTDIGRASDLAGACMTEDGYCYFINYDTSLCRWDLYTGEVVTLLNLKTEAISENGQIADLVADERGEVILYLKGTTMETYVLSQEEPSTDGYLTVVSLEADCQELKAAAAEYTRKNPGDGILVDADFDDAESHRTRLLADIAAGNMPDALYVSGADMEMLYEKGLLADLTGVFPEALKEQIFPGVLGCGQIDGKQIGLPLQAELSAMLVNRDVWSGERWSVKDVVALVKSGKVAQLETLVGFSTGGQRQGVGFGELGILQALALEGLESSPFLDLEAGECHFDSPEFVELLKLIKQYGYGKGSILQQGAGADPGVLAYAGNVRDIQNFSFSMTDLGGDAYHCVGFPTEQGSGCYWSCDRYLVVSSQTSRTETVQGLIEMVYSYTRQQKSEAPLRRDVFVVWESLGVREGPYGDGTAYYCFLSVGDASGRPIVAKPDGTSWVAEFLELADRAEARPGKADRIAEFVREEAEAFFNGDKSAEDVAGLIQSRVWLYLKE